MISNEKPSYNSVTEEIEALNIPFKEKLLAFFTAILFAIIILIGPMTIIINLFIFKDLRSLLGLSIEILLILLVFLTEFFYYKGITKNQVKHLNQILTVDTMHFTAVILSIGLILSYMGVF